MSWKKDLMTQRFEFITLALTPGANRAELCRRFEISRKTGYKWLSRFGRGGAEALQDQSHRVVHQPMQTASTVESKVVALRVEHPTWGPRKLRRRLQDLSQTGLPAVSTVGRILRRHALIDRACSHQHEPMQRFARSEPNQLWQMDFKGHFALQCGGRCHPLTILDDCSRYSIGLTACADEQADTVQGHLQSVFGLYGLPWQILCDNGPPWSGAGFDYTCLAVWLMRLGVQVIHGRPFHPQTQGKDERFHRTLKHDLLARHDWLDLLQAQRRFDGYRHLYNHDRPHEALQLEVPATRYRPSPRSMPARLLPIEYAENTVTRRVKSKGEITFQNRFYYIGKAFTGFDVALHPTATDGLFRVAFAAIPIGQIDLAEPNDRPKGHYFTMLAAPQIV
jgi:transposase InsO family protein